MKCFVLVECDRQIQGNLDFHSFVYYSPQLRAVRYHVIKSVCRPHGYQEKEHGLQSAFLHDRKQTTKWSLWLHPHSDGHRKFFLV